MRCREDNTHACGVVGQTKLRSCCNDLPRAGLDHDCPAVQSFPQQFICHPSHSEACSFQVPRANSSFKFFSWTLSAP